MVRDVVVVDYGLGNLFSVCRALEHCGARPVVCSDPSVVARAQQLILPGVGAFGDAMTQLTSCGMDEAIVQATNNGAPLLGICLGMQLLLSSSEEFGFAMGLGLIPGHVTAVPKMAACGDPLKIPHIGWNAILPSVENPSWVATPLDGIAIGSAVYFVHSFMAVPDNPEHRLADCIYGDNRIAAVISRDQIFGTQFHPEKSGKIGLDILNKFIASI